MISCDKYDYIEIVCMYRYPIKLTMKSGTSIECTALDTQRNESGKECINVSIKGIASKIELDTISKLEICIDNPNFIEISFT